MLHEHEKSRQLNTYTERCHGTGRCVNTFHPLTECLPIDRCFKGICKEKKKNKQRR
jgi:hypothetical protein